MKMKEYIIKIEHRADWNPVEGDLHNDNDWIVTEKEIEELAAAWGKEKGELLEEVEEI